jgi:hypothetical protein
MTKRSGGNSAWDNGFDRTGPGAFEYFEERVGFFLKERIYDENSEQFRHSTMREDRQKAIAANTLLGTINRAVGDFIYKKDGNRDDAYEVLFSMLSERAVKKLAYEKYNLIDPLNTPTAGTASK